MRPAIRQNLSVASGFCRFAVVYFVAFRLVWASYHNPARSGLVELAGELFFVPLLLGCSGFAYPYRWNLHVVLLPEQEVECVVAG